MGVVGKGQVDGQAGGRESEHILNNSNTRGKQKNTISEQLVLLNSLLSTRARSPILLFSFLISYNIHVFCSWSRGGLQSSLYFFLPC